jgi:elongation factor Ts
MVKIKLDQIKKLRAETKAGVMDCRKALEACDGDEKKAKEWLRKKGIEGAAKRADRETSCGLVEAYSHSDGRVVAVVELLCETDFVARTDGFKELAHELAMQIAAMSPNDTKELLNQAWIKNEKRKMEDLVKEAIGKFGENIRVERIARLELGKKAKN